MTLEGARYQRGESVDFAQFPVVPTMGRKNFRRCMFCYCVYLFSTMLMAVAHLPDSEFDINLVCVCVCARDKRVKKRGRESNERAAVVRWAIQKHERTKNLQFAGPVMIVSSSSKGARTCHRLARSSRVGRLRHLSSSSDLHQDV